MSRGHFSSYSIKPDSSCLPCLGTIPHYSTFPWINEFLKISYRYGFTTKIFEVQQLFDSAMHDLFTKMHSPGQCLLYPLLPSRKDRYITVRPRGHDYELPNCIYNLHKQSYITNCLFIFCDVFLIHCTSQICFLLVLYFYLVLYFVFSTP